MTDKADSAYKSIGEVAEELGLQQHVLRFWESKFSQLQPIKSGRGRRLYRPEDVHLVAGIRDLLHERGFSIRGAQQYIVEHGVEAVRRQISSGSGAETRAVTDMVSRLEQVRDLLQRAREELKTSLS